MTIRHIVVSDENGNQKTVRVEKSQNINKDLTSIRIFDEEHNNLALEFGDGDDYDHLVIEEQRYRLPKDWVSQI